MSPERNVPPGPGPFAPIEREKDILRLGLQAAAQCGDPEPELIEHTIGTRETATEATGSIVHSDEPSYLIAIKGHFTARRPDPPRRPNAAPIDGEDFVSFSVGVLVVDIQTGRVTDSGSSQRYPDLDSVGPVVTDHRSRH
jgi:hypothetical protein